MRAFRIGLVSVVALGLFTSAAFAGDGSVKWHSPLLTRTFGTPGSEVMLNPQPLPPKETHQFVTFGSEVMLNPQPLPPKIIGPNLLDTDPVLRTNGPAPTGTPIATFSR